MRVQIGQGKAKESKTKSGQFTDKLYHSSWLHHFKRLVFLLPCLKKKETIRKKEIDLHVNTEVDEPVHVNTKKRSIAERKLDLLIKCTEAILTKKIKRQELKASPFSIHVEEKLNGLDKHRGTFSEKRVCDVLFDVEMSNEIENPRYAVNGLHFLPGTPNNAAQNFQL